MQPTYHHEEAAHGHQMPPCEHSVRQPSVCHNVRHHLPFSQSNISLRQSNTTLTSSTSSLISSPISSLTRGESLSSTCTICQNSPPPPGLGSIQSHLNGSNGLSLLTRSISLVFSQTSANFPKNSKFVLLLLLLLLILLGQYSYFSTTLPPLMNVTFLLLYLNNHC